MITLQKIGAGYVNSDEISHITCDYTWAVGVEKRRYTVYMKNGSIFGVSEEQFTEYYTNYLKV